MTIFLTNDKLSICDQDNSEITSYTKKLSDLLHSNNITILHTSEASIIVRPSKIQAVLVSEDNQTEQIKLENKNEIVEIEEPETEDIISD